MMGSTISRWYAVRCMHNATSRQLFKCQIRQAWRSHSTAAGTVYYYGETRRSGYFETVGIAPTRSPNVLRTSSNLSFKDVTNKMAAPMRSEVVRLLCQQLRRLSASQIIPKWNVISQEQTSVQCIRNVAAAAISYHTSSQDNVKIPDLSFEELQKAKSYFNSTDYNEKYQGKPVWANYKRNFKGQVPPEKTRKKCIRGKGENRKVASNACPICRDENLVVDYQNIELLNQFICPHSWEVYSDSVTGVCQQQQKLIIKAIEKARAHGLILYEVQKVHFNYEDYFKKQANAR